MNKKNREIIFNDMRRFSQDEKAIIVYDAIYRNFFIKDSVSNAFCEVKDKKFHKLIDKYKKTSIDLKNYILNGHADDL